MKQEILKKLGYNIGVSKGGSFPDEWEGRKMEAWKDGYGATAHYEGGLDLTTKNEIIGSYRVGPGPGDFAGGRQVSVCKVYKDWETDEAWMEATTLYLQKREERMAKNPSLTGIVTPIRKY